MPRRSFLGRLAVAAGSLLAGGAGAAAFRAPGSEPTGDGWYGFCGHTFTTGSCPGPFPLPRVDPAGYPLRPDDGHPVDNLGRPIAANGTPIGADGLPLTDPSGSPLPAAPRTRICEDWVPEEFGVDVQVQGSWYRCCNGNVRKLSDCCSRRETRINGDPGLQGYCRPGDTVFCVQYIDTGVPC